MPRAAPRFHDFRSPDSRQRRNRSSLCCRNWASICWTGCRGRQTLVVHPSDERLDVLSADRPDGLTADRRVDVGAQHRLVGGDAGVRAEVLVQPRLGRVARRAARCRTDARPPPPMRSSSRRSRAAVTAASGRRDCAASARQVKSAVTGHPAIRLGITSGVTAIRRTAGDGCRGRPLWAAARAPRPDGGTAENRTVPLAAQIRDESMAKCTCGPRSRCRPRTADYL
jgi:hypothetical protein